MIGTILIPVIIVWCIGFIVIMLESDREHAKRMRASKKVFPLTSDQEAARGLYRQRDRDRVNAMRSTRYQDQQAWEIRYQEASHIRHIRQFKTFWDGTITIGEN